MRKVKSLGDFKCPRTPHWNLTQSWKHHIKSTESASCMLLWTCTASHVQELASVWLQSCHGHSWELSFLLIWFDSICATCRKCESPLLGFCRVGCSYRLHNPQAWDWMITTVMSYLQYASSSLGSPVDCVPVLLVVVILLVAAVAVQLLLLLGVKPPVRWQRAVSALLGLELLQFGKFLECS